MRNEVSLGVVSHHVLWVSELVFKMLGTNGEKHSVCVDGVVGPEHEDHIRGGRVVVVSVGASINGVFISREVHLLRLTL